MEEVELKATPSGLLPIGSKKEMSAGLRERLKRCSRYSVSPSTASKRSCKEPSPTTALTSSGRAVFQTPPSSKISSSLGESRPPSKPVAQAHPFTSTDVVSMDELFLPIDLRHEIQVKKLKPKKLLDISVLNSPSESTSDCVSILNATFTPETNMLRKVHSSRNLLSVPIDTKISSDDKNFDVSSTISELEVSRDVRYLESSCNNGVGCSSVNDGLLGEGNWFPADEVVKRKRELDERIKRKEESLRKLNLVKMYRVKNDLNKLDGLTSKWKSVCQEALQDLLASAPEPRPNMTQLINHLQIDPQMVDYNVEDESFA